MDPEIVIPSEAGASDLRFWSRMSAWSTDPEPRLGPATMVALLEVISSPPTVRGLAQRDFWKLVQTFAVRAFVGRSEPRRACESHALSARMDVWGANDNEARLRADLEAAGEEAVLTFCTDEQSWPNTNDPRCASCISDPVFLRHAPNPDPEVDHFQGGPARRFQFRQEAVKDVTRLGANSASMFPAIEFAPAAWSRVSSLQGGQADICEALIEHLGVLNDYAARIWSTEPTTEGRQSALASLGVSASPESPQIHRNSAAMSRRRIAFESGIVTCEWHTKLRPNVNRIYFEIADEKIRVGAIVDHL